ncbi:hypothetical protein GH742_09090 [Legionella sp. MW5194]|uniref:hypothetical protein n=1 Tax=Legionella sp. MW5194 TaxID=2662448 RepID=UPI00193D9651|nr:hypothetical protein [Legionella sp. MW5194]QRN04011.1 hypothetical protein GH742_09090 [Legionella sp. MW5194]
MPNFKFFTRKPLSSLAEVAKKVSKKGLSEAIKKSEELTGKPLNTAYWTLNFLLPAGISLTQQITNTILTIQGEAKMTGISVQANVLASATFAPPGALGVNITVPQLSVPLNFTGSVAQFLNINEQQIDKANRDMVFVLLAFNVLHLLRKYTAHWAKEYDKKREYPKLHAGLYAVEELLRVVGIPLLMYAGIAHLMYNNTPESTLFAAEDSKAFNEQKTAEPPLAFNFIGQGVGITANALAAGGVSGNFNASLVRQEDRIANDATILMAFASVILGLSLLLRLTRFGLDYGPSMTWRDCGPCAGGKEENETELAPPKP